MLGFDAMDPALTRALVGDGRLPAFAELLGQSGLCRIRNPIGLFVGTLWSTLFTGLSGAKTGFHCWEEIVPGSYERRLTSADSIRGTPFWETLSDSGRHVAVLDVPHARAGRPLNGVQLAEWGCHDRHFGLHSYPERLAKDVVARFGTHPVLGIDPWSAREWAPDDYAFRAGPQRSADEEEQLLEGMLSGARTKSLISAEILAQEPWDLFLSVFGETHSIGHQAWHIHDRAHPRHDPGLRARLGDPLVRVYEQMDRALAEHLRLIDEDTTLLVLLSHGIGPHNDGTHLLPEILRALDGAYRGIRRRSWKHRAVAGAWLATSDPIRSHLRPLLAKRLRDRPSGPAHDHETEEQRRAQQFFLSPNNFVVGGVRINVQGREPQGVIAPGREFDDLCARLRRDLLALVNVATGTPVVREVMRTDQHYPRRDDDALPDLFLEWNHDHPIETVWSPRFGTIHGPYAHWRTGDHRPDGLLLTRGPGIAPGSQLPELAVEDLAPSIACRLDVPLHGVDGVAVPWLSSAVAPAYA
jgi:predicted AlkP superfamily phosphohydrolase/phosphomutase